MHAPAPREPTTRPLLTAGVVAGPTFLVVVGLQLLTRDGFDIAHHPISLLSLTAVGWVQIVNFVATGLLYGLFALGLSRAWTSGPGRVWGPRLVAVMAAGLVAGGVFVADPALGYPPGTPDSIPDTLSWHGGLHAAAPPLAFAALLGAGIVMARRFHAAGMRGWAWYTMASGALAFAIPAVPHPGSMSWRILLAVAVGFGWLTALALRERAATQPLEQHANLSFSSR